MRPTHYQNSWALIVCALFVFTPPVEARSNRQAHIPNGAAFSCDSCHGRESLTIPHLTPFGRDVNANMVGGVVQWQNIWMLDSDGDGFSNGLELNDPNGQWRRGNPNPVGPISNPGVPNAGICGNGVLEDGEACEPPGTIACRDIGLGEGTVECRDCQWDTWNCGRCGDGILNPVREECDGQSFGEKTCADYGFLSGNLVCNERCRIESTSCDDEAPAVCGDGILSRGEQCDGDQFGEVDCARLNFLGGELLCTPDCKWNAERCIERNYEDDPFVPGEEPDPTMPVDPTNPQEPTSQPSDSTDASCATAGSTPSVLLALSALFLLRR